MSHTDSLLAQSLEADKFTGIKSDRRVLTRLVWDLKSI